MPAQVSSLCRETKRLLRMTCEFCPVFKMYDISRKTDAGSPNATKVHPFVKGLIIEPSKQHCNEMTQQRFNVHHATSITLTTRCPQQEWAEFATRCVARSKDHERIGTSNASLSTISSTFNSLFKVLCIFPSRYLCAIGLSPVFSFRWNLPPNFGLHSQTTRLFDHPTTTLSQNNNHSSHERDYHPPWCHFPMDFDSVGSVWMDWLIARLQFGSQSDCPHTPAL